MKLKDCPPPCKNSRKFPLPKISHVMHVYKHEAYRSDNCTPLRQPLSQSINDRSVSLEMVSFYCAVLSAVSLWRINLSFDRSFSFYRAMLCIRAVYAGMRCLSVCPSVTFASCAKTNEDIFEIFSPSGSQTILVFSYETACMAIFRREPPNGGVECTWGRQKSRF